MSRLKIGGIVPNQYGGWHLLYSFDGYHYQAHYLTMWGAKRARTKLLKANES